MLLKHVPNFSANRESTTNDILTALIVFRSDTTGCTNSNGVDLTGPECFVSAKNQINTHIKNWRVLDEIKRMVFEKTGIRGTRRLKTFLIESFPTFQGDVQHDAGDAYLSIIECLPDLESICNLTLRKTRSCIDCGKTETKDGNQEWCMMLNYEESTVRPLQVAVDEWCNATSRLIKNCACKYRNVAPIPDGAADFYFTEHIETAELIDVPDVLHVKVKDRFRQRNCIIISEEFFLNGIEYMLKSGMLYTGTGDRGHWRCIVKNGGKLIVYDDEKNPIRGGKRDLRNGTDFIFVKNTSSEPRTRIQKRALSDDTGGTLSIGRVKRALFEDDSELVQGFQNFGITSSGEIDTCSNVSDAPLIIKAIRRL